MCPTKLLSKMDRFAYGVWGNGYDSAVSVVEISNKALLKNKLSLIVGNSINVL